MTDVQKARSQLSTPGARFRAALQGEFPLQIVGTINAYTSLMAEQAGFKAIYLSGAGVANACYGLPDLGMVSLSEIETEVRRITAICQLPLLVDVDTAGSQPLMIERTITQLIAAKAAACHIEDQTLFKRCGHRDNKQLVSTAEMCARINAALVARSQSTDPEFFIIARTDAASIEGLASAIARAQAYKAAGADAIFAEALTSIDEYTQFCKQIDVPVLANLTEFGRTPILTREACSKAKIAMMLHPLTAFRAMNLAAERTYQTLRETGHVQDILPTLQTRERLYEYLQYKAKEKILDDYFDRLTPGETS